LEDELRDVSNRVSQKLQADFNLVEQRNRQLAGDNERLERELKRAKDENDQMQKTFKNKLDEIKAKIQKELISEG